MFWLSVLTWLLFGDSTYELPNEMRVRFPLPARSYFIGLTGWFLNESAMDPPMIVTIYEEVENTNFTGTETRTALSQVIA